MSILVGGHVGALSNWVSGGFKIFSHRHSGHRNTRRTNTSWFNWSNKLLCAGKQSHQPSHTGKYWSDVKSKPLIRICQVCVEETHKSAPIVTVTFSVILHTSGQLKHSEQRLSNHRRAFSITVKVCETSSSVVTVKAAEL